MEWSQLLSPERIGQEKQYPPEPHRPPWQYDHDRITFSSAFRRLQDKTQVFPLSSSDYIRTRLTHSMEASTVARSLGTWTGFELDKKLGDIHPLEVGIIVSAAALAHDIGNPPFGHSGEDAIKAWFLSDRNASRFRSSLTESQISDIANFEGNAQGFRILTRLQMYKDSGGMRLTAATLGAFVKYPVRSSACKPFHAGASAKKFGFFQSDAATFERLAEILGLVRRGDDMCWCRHPLAFLVEAADDICYRTVDLEDAFQQGLIDYKTTETLFAGVIGDSSLVDRARSESTERDCVNVLRSQAIRKATEEACKTFSAKSDEILEATFDEPIIDATPEINQAFKAIKDVQKEKVFKNGRVLRVESAGFRVIGGLLDAFANAVFDVYEATKTNRVPKFESSKLFDLLPDEFVGPKRVIADSPYERLLRVTDYICGMTDTYALNLFRNISGISLP